MWIVIGFTSYRSKLAIWSAWTFCRCATINFISYPMNWVTVVNSTYSTYPATGKRFNSVVAQLMALLIRHCFFQTALFALVVDQLEFKGYLAIRKSSTAHVNFPDGYWWSHWWTSTHLLFASSTWVPKWTARYDGIRVYLFPYFFFLFEESITLYILIVLCNFLLLRLIFIFLFYLLLFWAVFFCFLLLDVVVTEGAPALLRRWGGNGPIGWRANVSPWFRSPLFGSSFSIDDVTFGTVNTRSSHIRIVLLHVSLTPLTGQSFTNPSSSRDV